jgi:hypothetical protein
MDCPAIIAAISQNLEPYYKEQFEEQHQAIHELATALLNIAGLAYSSLLVAVEEHVIVEGSPPTQLSQHSSQSSGDIPIPYRGYTVYFEKFFLGLTTDAEKAAFLATDRLKTVNAANASIAILQLTKLAAVSFYRDACSKYVASLGVVRSQRARAFAALIQGFAQRLSSACDSIQKAMDTIASLPRPPSSVAPKTPNKSRANRAPPTILSPSQLLTQRRIDTFLLRIAKTVGHLSSMADGHAFLAADERFVRTIDSLDDPMAEEILTDATIQHRRVAGSDASRFQAEAHNHIPHGANSDSHDSGYDSEMHDSDRDFLASQQSETSERLLPRYALARSDINAAGKVSHLPDIISLTSVKDLPIGYCCRGHLILKRIVCMSRKSKNRKRHIVQCSFCDASSEDAEIFTCVHSDTFSCLPCLTRGATFAAPPSCPIDACNGKCSVRFLPSITSLCHNGHNISADTNFWTCSKSSCKTKLCFLCCPATIAAPQPHLDAPLNELPSPSPSCSPKLNPASNGPGAPMRPSSGQ